MKELLILLMLVPLAAIAQKETDPGIADPPLSGKITRMDEDFGIQPDSIAPDNTGIRNLTSVALSKEMIPGSELLILYPNPAYEIIHLECNDIAVHHGELFNPNGKLIRILPVEQGLNTYIIEDLKTGLYFIKMSGSHGNIIQKLVKR